MTVIQDHGVAEWDELGTGWGCGAHGRRAEGSKSDLPVLTRKGLPSARLPLSSRPTGRSPAS